MTNITPGHSSKISEGRYSLSFAVMHSFFHFFYSIGYDPSCEEMPSRELIDEALAVFIRHEEDSNASLTEDRKATDFEWRRFSPRPFERAEMYFGTMVRTDGREPTFEFGDDSAWLFQGMTWSCLEHIAFAAAWCGVHDIIVDAMYLCTKRGWLSEYTVDHGIMPVPMSILEGNLSRLLNDIGTTHQERDVCEYLAAHEKMELASDTSSSPYTPPSTFVEEIKSKLESHDYNSDYIQKTTQWYLSIGHNMLSEAFMRRDTLCNVMYSNIEMKVWHGYYELDSKLHYRPILKDPN